MINAGSALRFSAVDHVGVSEKATWKVVDPPSPKGGTISPTTGEYVAPLEVEGECVVTIETTALDNPSRVATARVMVASRRPKSLTYDEASIKQLERVFDYTKFHIGLYTTLATIMIAAMSEKVAIFGPCTRPMMSIPIAAIVVAGVAGGVITRNTLEFRNYDEFSSARVSPFARTSSKPSLAKLRLSFRAWSNVEHKSFWVAIVATLLILLAKFVGRAALGSNSWIIRWIPGCS